MSSKGIDLKALPKIELHVHLDGAVRAETLIELAAAAKVKLPTTDPVKLAKGFVPTGKKSLTAFLKRFDRIYPCLSTPEAVERVAFEQCADLARQNVKYFETRFAPILFAGKRASMSEIVRAALNGLARGREAFKIQNGLILCILRGMKLREAVDTAEIALAYRSRGVCGIDLAGDEEFDDTEYQGVFDMADEQGLAITVHAGESGPASNIRRAIEEFHARRIGHAASIMKDPTLIYDLRERDIAVENCLTSNLLTGAVQNLKSHPFKLLLDRNVKVTLNSDDPLVCGTTLTKEFELAQKTFGLTEEHFKQLYKNALSAAFIPKEKRSSLVK